MCVVSDQKKKCCCLTYFLKSWPFWDTFCAGNACRTAGESYPDRAVISYSNQRTRDFHVKKNPKSCTSSSWLLLQIDNLPVAVPSALYHCLLRCVWCWSPFLGCSSLFWQNAASCEFYQNFTNILDNIRASVFWASFTSLSCSDSGK